MGQGTDYYILVIWILGELKVQRPRGHDNKANYYAM